MLFALSLGSLTNASVVEIFAGPFVGIFVRNHMSGLFPIAPHPRWGMVRDKEPIEHRFGLRLKLLRPTDIERRESNREGKFLIVCVKLTNPHI